MSKNTRTLNATTVPALPSAPNKIDPELKKFLDKMVEAVEIRLGRRGDTRDRAITLRELISSGLAKELAANPYDPNAIDFGVPSSDNLNLSQAVGKPENLQASAAFSTALIQWDLWKHRNHFRTHIYRNTSDIRSTAVFIGTSDGQFFTDEDVTSGTTYYYWARHENTHGDMSEWNAESGTSATVAQDVLYILNLLAGAIDSSHLAASLATDVGRIPGWHTLIGNYSPSTVNYRSLTDINSQVTTTAGNFTTLNTTVTGAGGHSSKITSLETTVNNPTTGVVATSSALDVLETKVGYSYLPNSGNRLFDNSGAIKSSTDATAYNTANGYTSGHANYVAWQDGMGAAQMSTRIQVDDGTGTFHTLEQQAQTIHGTNGLSSQYSVKINANGHVAGFGLASSSPTAGNTTSEFIVAADKFSIVDPAGGTGVPVFTTVTSTQVVNGVTVQPGVYIDGLKVQDGSITNVKLGNAIVDDAKISSVDAGKISSGTMDTGRLNVDGATLDSNNAGALQVANLGITSAKIGNAEVGTLKIQDQAVVHPYGLSGTGGISVAYNASNTVTSWTAIDNGGVTMTFNQVVNGVTGLTPSKVTILLINNFIHSNGSNGTVVSQILRIYDPGSGTWHEEGHVGYGAVQDQSLTLTSGATITPSGAGTTSGGGIIIRAYARQLYTGQPVTTGAGQLIVLGTKK
tara:strand:+ start:619 stop:2679 length:2061 start_codon:yes stop_codon:yes gene_type:complete